MKAAARIALALAAVPLGIVAYRIQVHDYNAPGARAAGQVAVAWAFLAAGLVLWWRRPSNRVGILLVASAFALLVRPLRYSHDPAIFTSFFALGEVSFALVGLSLLAYPTGSLYDRAERSLVKLAWVVALVVPVATLLVYDSSRPLAPIFSDRARRESLLLVADDADLAVLMQKALVVMLYGVLATLFVLLIARRFARSGPRERRRVLAPLLLAAVALALRSVFQCVFTFVDRPFAYDYLYWWQFGAFIAVPLAFLVVLLRARLARVAVGDLVVELEHTPPQGLRDALARALEDPTLEVAFWLPERQGFVDGAGRAVELPPDGATRAVTRLDDDGEPVAALIHDPSLLEEPRLVEAAGAAARLALDNARLHAETRAQLAEVQASRARIVEAADAERRRIERDLHDGAQQRLVALALQVRSAQPKVGDVELERLLAETVAELQEAVRELRELARGVHPAVLTEDGLAAALESLAARSPLPVSLDVCEERLPTQTESTAYFVACEGLANIVKHAEATKATIRAARRDGVLVVEVEDDGVGGARVEEGSGLRGLTDRVETVGGRLSVTSPASGTRIVAEIPCAQ